MALSAHHYGFPRHDTLSIVPANDHSLELNPLSEAKKGLTPTRIVRKLPRNSLGNMAAIDIGIPKTDERE